MEPHFGAIFGYVSSIRQPLHVSSPVSNLWYASLEADYGLLDRYFSFSDGGLRNISFAYLH